MSLRIKKIKYAEKTGKVIMKYERYINDQYDEYNFASSENPAPEFFQAFDALKDHARNLLELPGGYEKRLDVYGVSFSYSGDEDVMGATMQVRMELNNSNTDLVINTPHKKAGPDNGENFNEKQCLTEECVKSLWELERQARLYIDGKRAQVSLFAEDTAGADVDAEQSVDQVDEVPLDDIDDDFEDAIPMPPEETIYDAPVHQ